MEAQALGKEIEAKWMLHHIAKDDIVKLEKKNADKIKQMQERGIDVNDDGTLKVADKNRARARANSDEPMFLLTSSYTKNLD